MYIARVLRKSAALCNGPEALSMRRCFRQAVEQSLAGPELEAFRADEMLVSQCAWIVHTLWFRHVLAV